MMNKCVECVEFDLRMRSMFVVNILDWFIVSVNGIY